MLHKSWWSVGAVYLLAVVLLSAAFLRASGVSAQNEKESYELFLPIIKKQSNVGQLPIEEGHALDDYVLAEEARKRNEPPFKADPTQTRVTGPANQVGEWGPVKTWPFVFASVANMPDGRMVACIASEWMRRL